MIKVKTYLDKSTIPEAGIGLFAAEFIPKDTIVWEYNNKLDLLFTKEEVNSLSIASQEQIRKYIYLDKSLGLYLLCGDDARFFNHSDSPNCYDTYNLNPDVTMSNRDIQIGEEITCDYKSFYGNMEEHPEIK
jgi:SET domain-containing protein